MRTVNIHEAKTHLSRLVEEAAAGDGLIIAKAGRPIAKLVALDTPASGAVRRIGFLSGQLSTPEDFDTLGAEAIAGMFEGEG